MMGLINTLKNKLLGGKKSKSQSVGECDAKVNPSAEKLFIQLNAEMYRNYPYQTADREEGMKIVSQVIDGYWKPRYLLDTHAKAAYEVMSPFETLVTVTDQDIDWESLRGLSQKVVGVAKSRSFHYPGYIYNYANGIAEVEWQLQPDGMYYRDDDGYGMTADEEVTLRGAIDRKGKVVRKFTYKTRNNS